MCVFRFAETKSETASSARSSSGSTSAQPSASTLPTWEQWRSIEPLASQCDPDNLFPSTMALLAQSPISERNKHKAVAIALMTRYLRASEEKWKESTKPFLQPAQLLAGLASATGGRSVAQCLVQTGRERCLKIAARDLGLSAQQARAAAAKSDYNGPFLAFTDAARWAAIEEAARVPQENALWDTDSKPLQSLLLDMKRWFGPGDLTQDKSEGRIKGVKNVNPTQRGWEKTVCRMVRAHRNRSQCLDTIPRPRMLNTPSSLFEVLEKNSSKSAPLRLSFSANNPNHPALPAMTETERTALNRACGFNMKRTPEESRKRKSSVKTSLSAATHQAITATLRNDFATAALPPEPADPGKRKIKKRKLKSGKDEKSDYEEMAESED